MRLPQEPNRPTCPDINRIQNTILEIINNFKSLNETNTADDFLNCIADDCIDLEGISKELEDLRSSNGDLRNWGQELLSIAEKLSDERDNFECELQDAQSNINDLQSSLNSYEF